MSERIRLDAQGLAKPRWWEYLVRFFFGGAVTAATGAIAKGYGSSIGGLFLAFPAIVPAALTLMMKHDGRRACVEDARGSMCGAVGMMVFAAVVAATSLRWPAVVVLATAAVAWLAVSAGLWCVTRRRLQR